MKLNLSTSVKTEQLAAILGSVGAGAMLSGVVYTPIMQVLIAPTQQGENSLVLWELTQKLYANKDGEVDLTDEEVKIIKSKLEQIAFPWLKARLLDLFK
jgi:hypothetical protein